MSGGLDFYDNGNGSVLVAWAPFPGISPASYNVYLDGVLKQNVVPRQATVAGMTVASYNGTTETLPTTHTIRVAAVVGGIEVAALDGQITPTPQQVMLTTPMSRGRFPFPNTPGGY